LRALQDQAEDELVVMADMHRYGCVTAMSRGADASPLMIGIHTKHTTTLGSLQHRCDALCHDALQHTVPR
jgi:hypothetical protein